MIRCLIFCAIAALLCSCAKPPNQELDAAEYMVGKAHAMKAMEFSPVEYQAAQTALDDARKAMQKEDYGDARDSLEFSLQHARRAVVLAREGLSRLAEEETMRAFEEEKARQAAANVREIEAVPQPQETPAPVKKPLPKPKPKITLVSSYDVGEGETLWTISAQPQVYNEGLLWPLLYQANRDQIKDPRQIFPGQSLSIRRDMTEKDLEDARQRARESDIFSVSETVSPAQ